jgi:ferredoxin
MLKADPREVPSPTCGQSSPEARTMGKVQAFYIDADLCTECGDCIKVMPQAFRKVEDEEVAEVYNTDLDEALLPILQKTMTECPGHAILWKK